MNTSSDAMPGSPTGSQVSASPLRPPAEPLWWSVRRELWETRSIYLAPLAAAAAFLFAFVLGLAPLAGQMRAAALDAAQQHKWIESRLGFAAGLIMATTVIVGIFYCLDALYAERRDRSILFWKSLPVSDLTTVLAKASIPFVVLPLITFAVTVAVQFPMLLFSDAVLRASGHGVASVWGHVSLFDIWGSLLYHLVTVHALWHAPLYAWLLLVSAWARRAPVLWAALPLLAIGFIEKITFNTSYFARMLGNRLAGGPESSFTGEGMPMHGLAHITPGNFITSPGLWIGLAVAAAFLAAAVRLRRYREPI